MEKVLCLGGESIEVFIFIFLILVIFGVFFVVGRMLLWLGLVFCDNFIFIIFICGEVVCLVKVLGENCLFGVW